MISYRHPNAQYRPRHAPLVPDVYPLQRIVARAHSEIPSESKFNWCPHTYLLLKLFSGSSYSRSISTPSYHHTHTGEITWTGPH